MAPNSATERLSEIEWRVYLADSYEKAQAASWELTGVRPMRLSNPVPVLGYRALNDLLLKQFKGHVSRIEYKAIDGRWYRALDKRK